MKRPTITRKAFIEGYCERSNISWEELSKWSIVRRCFCESEDCEGWAMLNKAAVKFEKEILAKIGK